MPYRQHKHECNASMQAAATAHIHVHNTSFGKTAEHAGSSAEAINIASRVSEAVGMG